MKPTNAITYLFAAIIIAFLFLLPAPAGGQAADPTPHCTPVGDDEVWCLLPEPVAITATPTVTPVPLTMVTTLTPMVPTATPSAAPTPTNTRRPTVTPGVTPAWRCDLHQYCAFLSPIFGS